MKAARAYIFLSDMIKTALYTLEPTTMRLRRAGLGTLPSQNRDYVNQYTACEDKDTDECVWGLIRAAQSSVAEVCVVPLQDYLCLGNEARMNTPSTLGDNWKWRLTRGQLTDEIIHRINAMTRLYGRIQENKK